MKDEEIKELASKYANSAKASSTHITEKAFIAGAHSRDEEIAYLEYRLNDSCEKLKTAMTERDNIRNPWISVDEQLPEVSSCEECSEKVIFKSPSGAKIGVYYPNRRVKWFDTSRNLGIDSVTHWMPIPEIQTETTNKTNNGDAEKVMYYTEPFNWIVAKAIMEGKIDGYIETKCGFKANIVAFRCVSLPNPLVVVISNAEQTVLVYPLDGKHGRYDDSYDLRLVLTHRINERLLNTGVKI